MSRQDSKASGAEVSGNIASIAGPIRFVVVGDVLRWKELGLSIPNIQGFVFIDIEDVTAAKIAEIAPKVILSPLLCRNFDALEIARRLHNMRYAGRYSVVIKDIPDPSVIDRDIRQVAPDLDFSVLTLPLADSDS